VAAPTVNSNNRALQVLLLEDIAESYTLFCSYVDLGSLACVCLALRNLMAKDRMWRFTCLSFANSFHLYLPNLYALGWRRLFWEQLWPAQHKWSCVDRLGVVGANDADPETTKKNERPQGHTFNIRVAVRLRPYEDEGLGVKVKKGFVLPLHQRAQLVRRGVLSAAQLFDHAEGSGDDESLVRSLAATGEKRKNGGEEGGRKRGRERRAGRGKKWKVRGGGGGRRGVEEHVDACDAAGVTAARNTQLRLKLKLQGAVHCFLA
jgi:hypothetical protein